MPVKRAAPRKPPWQRRAEAQGYEVVRVGARVQIVKNGVIVLEGFQPKIRSRIRKQGQRGPTFKVPA